MSTQHQKHIFPKTAKAKRTKTKKIHPATSHCKKPITDLRINSHNHIASHAFSTTTATATTPPITAPPTMPTPLLAPIHAETTHEFSSEKTITTTPEVFQYLERFGRRHYPLVQQLRKDTLEKRQETIRFLLEPTTCSLLEQQLRLSAGLRVLEVGVFTGVTSLALAHNVVANYNKAVAKQQKAQQQHDAQQQNQKQYNQQQQPLDTTSLPNHISGLAAQLSAEQRHNIIVKRREYNAVKRNFLKFKQHLSTAPHDNDNNDLGSLEDQDTSITDLDVMFYDADVTIRQLRAQQQQWNEQNTQQTNTSQSTTTTSPPPPLVIGLDLDNHTFQEVALPVFQDANMMGTPYVFLSGSALETFEKLMGSEDHTVDLLDNNTSNNHNPQQRANNNPFKGTFDLIFIDADKNNYLNYYEHCLELIKPETGLICIDNVLWKGGVVPYGEKSEVNNNNNDAAITEQQQQEIETADDKKLRKKREQQNKKRIAAGKEPIVYPLTKKPKRDVAEILHEFNAFIYNDPRVDALTLPLGDGLTIVRKLL